MAIIVQERASPSREGVLLEHGHLETGLGQSSGRGDASNASTCRRMTRQSIAPDGESRTAMTSIIPMTMAVFGRGLESIDGPRRGGWSDGGNCTWGEGLGRRCCIRRIRNLQSES